MIAAGFRILPAGERRLSLDGADDLPIREFSIDRDGRALTVWVGPAEPGGPEEELWELAVEA